MFVILYLNCFLQQCLLACSTCIVLVSFGDMSQFMHIECSLQKHSYHYLTSVSCAIRMKELSHKSHVYIISLRFVVYILIYTLYMLSLLCKIMQSVSFLLFRIWYYMHQSFFQESVFSGITYSPAKSSFLSNQANRGLMMFPQSVYE